MEIYATAQDLTQNLQQVFQDQYPHLKMRFLKYPPYAGYTQQQDSLLPLSVDIPEVSCLCETIDISPDRFVSEVEYDFFDKLNLLVEVFWQNGNLWLEAPEAEHCTLQQMEERSSEQQIRVAYGKVFIHMTL